MLWRGGLGIVRCGTARYGWVRFCYGKARRSRLDMVGCVFVTVRLGGLGGVSRGLVRYGLARRSRRGPLRLRSDMLWRGGQGVARSSSVRYGLSRRSRQGLLGRVGSRWGEAV